MYKIILLAFCTVLFSQKPAIGNFTEIDKLNNMRLKSSAETTYSIKLHQINEAINGASYEDKAIAFIKQRLNFNSLKNASNYKFIVSKIQKNHGITHVRLFQTVNDIPVYNSESVISFNRQDNVSMAFSSFKDLPISIESKAKITSSSAIQISKTYINDISERMVLPKNELVYVAYENKFVLSYKTNIHHVSKNLIGDFEFLIDAINGDILIAKNNIHFNRSNKNDKKKRSSNGSGRVFDPDPLSDAKKNYNDTGFTDANDANLDSLHAHTKLVTLEDLTFENGAFQLKNDHVQVVDFDPPFVPVVTNSDSTAFDFTRDQSGFEDVNVFYHMTSSSKYIESLGFSDIKPYLYNGGVRSDSHGASGADNSYYSPSTNELSWGEGGVDDAEDADVILHEYGHAIKDFVTGGQGLQGMGEGFGDYWAESYSRSISKWNPEDPQFKYVFAWDGHNSFWGGRLTEYDKSYPDDLIGQIHTDGGIWVTPLMRIFERLGREITDQLVLKSHYYITPSANQADGALAVLQASTDMFEGQYNSVIIEEFSTVGQIVSIEPYADVNTTDVYDERLPHSERNLEISITNQGVQDLVIKSTGNTSQVTFLADSLVLNNKETAMFPFKFVTTLPEGNYSGNIVLNTNDPNQAQISIPYSYKIINSELLQVDYSVLYPIEESLSKYISVYIKSYIDPQKNISVNATVSGVSQNLSATLFNETEHIYRFNYNVVNTEEVQFSVINTDKYLNVDTTYFDLVYSINTKQNSNIKLSDKVNIKSLNDNIDIYAFRSNHIETSISEKFIPISKSFNIDLKSNENKRLKLSFNSTEISYNRNEIGLYRFDEVQNKWVYTTTSLEGSNAISYIDQGGKYSFFVNSDLSSLPTEFGLLQNYPNPFNPSTIIPFELKNQEFVSLTIYNALGQKIKQLVNNVLPRARHEIQWDGTNEYGKSVPSGVYFYQIRMGQKTFTRKMLLLK